MTVITKKDFVLSNQWREARSLSQRYAFDSGLGDFVPSETVSRVWDEDQSTGQRYLMQKPWVLRAKCLGMAIGWPILNHVIRCVSRIFNIITLQSFAGGGSLKNRLISCGKDLLKIAATPILLVFLELAAIYGIFKPQDGRKLIASIERFAFLKGGMGIIDIFYRTNPYTAPCFQPNAQCHALGGDINNGDAW